MYGLFIPGGQRCLTLRHAWDYIAGALILASMNECVLFDRAAMRMLDSLRVNIIAHKTKVSRSVEKVELISVLGRMVRSSW